MIYFDLLTYIYKITNFNSEVCILVCLLEELLLVYLVRFDSLVTRLPVGWANLSIDICELESLDQSQYFVYTSADGVIVDLHATDLAHIINDKNTSQCCAIHIVVRIFNKHAIVP